MVLKVLDAVGITQSLSTSLDASGNLVGSTAITDPITGSKVTISAFHSADNLQPGGTAFGILAGGVGQLINASGNLDRQRGAPGTVGVTAVSSDGIKATYRYCTLAYAMVATPTDAVVIQGSSTKTIRVKRVMVSGQATSQGSMTVQLVRRSTAGTLGSAVLTAMTAAKHDINDGAASAAVSTVGTANYGTLGSTAGTVAVGRLGLSALATGTGGQGVTWDFATRQDKAIILRGVSDFLCINFNGSAIPSGGVVDFEIETEEDFS